MRLGERLKQLRLEKNLIQKEIAQLLNISTSAYGYYEQSKRDPDTKTLIILAEFFDVSVDYLLGLTDIKFPHPTEFTDTDLNFDPNTEVELTLLDSAVKQIQKYIYLRTHFDDDLEDSESLADNDVQDKDD